MDVNKVLFAFIKVIFSIVVILFIIVGTARLCLTGYDYGFRFFTETAVESEPGTDILVQVKDDTSSMDLAKMLERKGLIRDAKLFYMRLKLSAYSKSIQPGIYTLNTSMTPKEMMIAMSAQESTEEAASTETEASTEEVEPSEIKE
jgi:UPF0755 protein